MNELSTLLYKGTAVRVEIKNDEPWFVAKDVCDVLGIVNSRHAVTRLDTDEIDDVVISDAIGRQQEMTVVNEAGLYNLIFSSVKPEAKEFKRWVTHEVLPNIRKTGGYSVINQPPQHALAAARQLLEVAEDHEKRLRAVEERQLELIERPVLGAPPVGVAFPKMNPDYMPIRAYCKSVKIRIKRGQAAGIGHRLATYCRKAGIFFEESGSHGHRYPVPVLKEFFNE
jgi:prophage antirepressor-like protein